jgi:hypothetical protein
MAGVVDLKALLFKIGRLSRKSWNLYTNFEYKKSGLTIMANFKFLYKIWSTRQKQRIPQRQ